MEKHLFKLLTIVVLCCHLPLWAIPNIETNCYFTHITNDQGLSHSHVKAILQDSNGFMWFGTANRLNRYDGSSIINIDCYDDAIREGNNNINSLYEDGKNRIWIGTDRGVYVYDPRSERIRKTVVHEEGGRVPTNWVESIAGSPGGDIWAVVPNEGVYRFIEGDENRARLYSFPDNNQMDVTSSCIDGQGVLWIGSYRKGLFRYNPRQDVFERITADREGNRLDKIIITSLCKWNDDILLTSYEGKLYHYDYKQNLMKQIPIAVEQSSFFHAVKVNGDEIWQGTNKGIYIINTKTFSSVRLKTSFDQPFSLSDDNTSSIYFDKEGGVWIGTALGGVNYLSASGMKMEKYTVTGNRHSLSSNRIRGIVKDDSGNLWIGTEDKGLNILNPKTGEVIRFPYPNDGIDHSHIINLYIHDGNLYCSLFRQGVDVIRLSDRKLTHTVENALEDTDGVVWSMCVDRKKRSWIGSGGGLFMSADGGRTYERIREIDTNWIFSILEDREGNLWFCSRGNGIWMLENSTGAWHRYLNREGEKHSLSSNAVNSAMQDSRGRIWISTERGGICRYRPETDDFISYSIAEGLPDDIIYTVVEDRQQNLWFGTNRGLVKLNPDTGTIRVFTVKDGLLGNQFNYHSALIANDGRLYLGSLNGLIAFDPLLQEMTQIVSPMYITRLSIYNKVITPNSPGSPLNCSIMYADEITLSHDQNNLSLGVALPDYDFPGSIQYYYRMSPVDKDWIAASDHHDISFAHLPPGKYTFEVMALRDGQTKSITRSLVIDILPPWWMTRWAYLVYSILVLGTLLGWFLRYRQRKERQMEERLKLYAIEKEKELNESKVNFFTQIAHEIRTPLTLINGPLEAIFEMKLNHEKLTKYLSVISLNTKRLLELTTQLIDFQKTGASKWTVRFESINLCQLLQEMLTRFEPTIIQAGKHLEFQIPDQDIWAIVDRESVIKIVSNLLNNALKYGESKIEISLSSDEQGITIKVSNDGERIPADEVSRIFDPFYQISKRNVVGFGIGLSLARSLVELHKGELYVDESSAETMFVLRLPLQQEEMPVAQISGPDTIYSDVLSEESVLTPDDTDWKNATVLLVEDNEQLLSFLAERLRQTFTVEVARNGQEALELLREGVISLVVTDLMMPVMDGYELCTAVKLDIDICHIPVVLLTARNDLDSKIKGLKLGAEAYVEKPFSFGYLESQILSLLDNRMREREAFSKRPLYSSSNMQMNKADKDFVQKIEILMDQHLSNIDFSIEDLASSLNMSRSTLLRKFKSLFNLSPVKFMQLYRLKKAASLIQQGEYRIGEVYPMVGFASNSYFTRVFIEQFGMSPKDFELSQRRNNTDGAEI